MMATKEFRVAGVTFDNRQAIIEHMTMREGGLIIPEPDNVYDPLALSVNVFMDGDLFRVGYIPKDDTVNVARLLAAGWCVSRFYRKGGGRVSWGLVVVLSDVELEGV